MTTEPTTTAEFVDIVRVGHKGDGETAEGVYVPFTVPGDRVRIERAGEFARLVNVISPGPTRVKPKCQHFGLCGGCALQHVNTTAYNEWKREQVIHALAQRGIENADVAPIVTVQPNTRRRAVLSAKVTREGVVIGFQERASHFIVDVRECPVLHPTLMALIPKLRTKLGDEMSNRGQAEIGLTLTETGVDMTLGLPDTNIDVKKRQSLTRLASDLDLARLTVNEELVAQSRPPVMRWANVDVALPAGAFVQAVAEAEAAMQALAIDYIGKAKRVADLFAGCGALTFPLARQSAVAAYDSEADAIAALGQAARATQGLKPVTAERRDLFRRPLLKPELDAFDAIVMDPPRAGAKVQAEQLAKSQVRRIAAVSCNPATFARDARILIDGGYRLSRVTPIDQFLWSAHIELVALFERT